MSPREASAMRRRTYVVPEQTAPFGVMAITTNSSSRDSIAFRYNPSFSAARSEKILFSPRAQYDFVAGPIDVVSTTIGPVLRNSRLSGPRMRALSSVEGSQPRVWQ